MIELQLVGYTADLEYLVFCDAARGASRFKAPVDEDLLATLGELVERTDPQRFQALFPAPPAPPPVAAPAPAPVPPAPAPRRGPTPGEGPLAALAVLPAATGTVVPSQSRTAERPSRLSPREIQALLRAGRSPAAVARDADIDEEWVQRWLAPIEAERERILRAVRAATLHKARLGPSERPLGEAVDLNLRGKVRADETVEWSAARRDGDPYWSVSVRYRSRGRLRRARWRYNPDSREVTAEDKPSLDLAWSRSDAPAPDVPAAAEVPPRKPRAKKAVAKKGSVKKTAAKKAAAKNATATKRSAAKTAPAAKRSAAKDAPAATKKTAAPKTSAAKKTAAKKTAAPKTSAAKKTAAKKTAATKTSATKKAAPPAASADEQS